MNIISPALFALKTDVKIEQVARVPNSSLIQNMLVDEIDVVGQFTKKGINTNEWGIS